MAVPRTLKAYTIQFEAPGLGSPADAVELAGALRIHLWGAKNAPAGWVERAQEIARRRGVPVTFFPSNEEYGTYVSVPGLGTYSHLSDIFAPPQSDFGPSMSDPRNPVPWTQFRDQRIAALKRAGGGILWQFNENEELTRVLLDEAVEASTFDAVSSFHFGNENFLHSQPFLNIYRSQLPFVGLQDNHATEPWWSSAILGGFRTVFLAEAPTWQGWIGALRHNRIVSIRRDAVTNFQERLAGGSNGVRQEVLRRRQEWDWEGRLPPATVQLVRPGDPFEQPSPETGVAIRIRTRREHTNMGVLKDVVYDLEQLTVDNRPVTTEVVERHNKAGALIDLCHVANLETLRPGPHTATATLRHTTTARQIQKILHWT